MALWGRGLVERLCPSLSYHFDIVRLCPTYSSHQTVFRFQRSGSVCHCRRGVSMGKGEFRILLHCLELEPYAFSVEECFQFGVIMNRAAVHFVVCVFGEWKYFFLLGIHMGDVLVGNLVCLYHKIVDLKDILILGTGITGPQSDWDERRTALHDSR